jgi:hypothetical protein
MLSFTPVLAAEDRLNIEDIDAGRIVGFVGFRSFHGGRRRARRGFQFGLVRHVSHPDEEEAVFQNMGARKYGTPNS